jgi:pimeloyl-ACP methyl ester carboxylesterase
MSTSAVDINAPISIRNGRLTLALHSLRTADGPTLLLLHGLGEASPSIVPDALQGWPGSIYALDFCGHGASQSALGGGYSCEQLMSDVDAALAHIGPATIYGRGLGGYVGVLISGARPELVRGLIIDDGSGLAGGGTRPGSTTVEFPNRRVSASTPDPYALIELSSDVRPKDYATSFVRIAVEMSGLPTPIAVVAFARAPWLQAVIDEYGVVTVDLDRALTLFAI